MRVSCIINADSRPVSNEVQDMGSGVRSRDFIMAGIANKLKFFDGFEVELVVFLDQHEKLSPQELEYLGDVCDRLVISKHNKDYKSAKGFQPHNDINYLQALSLARGDVIVHFDQDMAAFRREKSHVDWLLSLVETDAFKYVCYPSAASPFCVNDAAFPNYTWASTRFFMCRKDTINLTELEAAIWEPQTLYAKYGQPPRVCPWTEHFLAIMAGGSVFYPPLAQDYLIFPWCSYRDGLLAELNALPYDEIAKKLIANGAHSYHGISGKNL